MHKFDLSERCSVLLGSLRVYENIVEGLNSAFERLMFQNPLLTSRNSSLYVYTLLARIFEL